MRALYVSVLALIVVILGFLFLFRATTSGVTVQPQVLAATTVTLDQTNLEMLNQINAMRLESGVSELVFDSEIAELTDFRISDMIARDYYSHKTPDGQSYINFTQEYGIDSTFSCENLQLQVGNDGQAAVQAWIDSPSHYRCLMDPRTVKVGISYGVHSEVAIGLDEQIRQMYVFALIASN